MKTLNLNFNTIELKNIKKHTLIHILNEAISTSALQYLLRLRKSKGKEIIYINLEMSEYLKPNNSGLKISEKKEIFSYRNKTCNISSNFKSRQTERKCVTNCGMDENMEHIFYCYKLSWKVIQTKKYTDIYNGNIEDQVSVYKILKQNMIKREEILNNIPSDTLIVDPLLTQ